MTFNSPAEMRSRARKPSAGESARRRASNVIFTGYTQFPGVSDNPSQRLMEALALSDHPALADSAFHLLDTEYATAPHRIIELLRERPRALIMTGYSAIARGLKIENCATDFCSPSLPDAAGFLPPEGNASIVRMVSPHVNFEALEAALTKNGIPAHVSSDAGSYVCNHSYFAALSHVQRERLSTPVIFIHLPAIRGSALAKRGASDMTLETMVEAMAVIARFWN